MSTLTVVQRAHLVKDGTCTDVLAVMLFRLELMGGVGSIVPGVESAG